MKKVTEEQLKRMQKDGATVKRRPKRKPKSDSQPAKKPVESPEKPTQPAASMRASMKAMEAQAEATRLVVAHNSEVIAGFGKDLKELVARERGLEYTFDIVRDDDKLLKRVYARPGIIEE